MAAEIHSFGRADPGPPPADLELEQALLAGILSDNRSYDQVGDWLMPAHFADALHARIYEALRSEIEAGRAADARSLASAMEAHDPQARDYLLELQVSFVNMDLRNYARVIYDLAQRRELLLLAEDMEEEARDLSELGGADEIIDSAAERLFSLSESGAASRKGPRSLTEIANNCIAHQEAILRGEVQPGMRTGLKDLDGVLHGLHRSDLIIVAGRASMGKTAFALELSHRVAAQRERLVDGGERPQPVLFFSLEMAAEQLGNRLLSRLSGLPADAMRDASTLSPDRIERMVEANQRRIRHLPFFVDDTPGITLSQIHARARQTKRRHGLAMIVVDYLQLMGMPAPRRGESINRTQQVGLVTAGLKGIAKALDIPVLALSQLSRQVEQREDKRPQLSDLRESGSIEQDADIVIFPYRAEYYLDRNPPEPGAKNYEEWERALADARNVTEIIIAKNRHGPVTAVKVFSDMTTGSYADLDWMGRGR